MWAESTGATRHGETNEAEEHAPIHGLTTDAKFVGEPFTFYAELILIFLIDNSYLRSLNTVWNSR